MTMERTEASASEATPEPERTDGLPPPKSDDEVLRRLRQRIRAKGVEEKTALKDPFDLEEYERAIREAARKAFTEGKAGVDYFPRAACDVCGAVPFVFGARTKILHDRTKHDVPAKDEHTGERPARGKPTDMKAAIDRSMQGVRRATGEHDND